MKNENGYTILNRHEFLKALDFIKPGWSRNDLIEESEMILFEPERVSSFNDEVAFRYPLKTGLKGATPAAGFYGLVKKLDGDEIRIKSQKNEIIIQCGEAEAKLNLIEDMAPPSLGIDEIKQHLWRKLPADFLDALTFCKFSAAPKIEMGVLTCLRVSGNEVWSCDNFRATRYQMKSELPKNATFYIPQQAVKKLFKSKHNLRKVKNLARTPRGSWLHFLSAEGAVFSCRTTDAEFPPVENLLGEKGESFELPIDLRTMLMCAEIFTDKKKFDTDRLIDIEISENQLICRSGNDRGWIQQEIEVKYSGKKIQIQVHPKSLYQILRRSQQVAIGKKYLSFEGNNFQHMMVRRDRQKNLGFSVTP